MVFPPIYYSPTVLGVSGGEGDASLRTPPTHFAMSGSNYSSARADFFRLLRCTLSPPGGCVPREERPAAKERALEPK